MLPKDKRKLALLIGAGILLVAFCIVVVMIIDARLNVDFGTDSSAGMLFYFIAGCIFLPRALRGYRAGRRQVPKIAWYRRLDLILCLAGLIFGLESASSVAQYF